MIGVPARESAPPATAVVRAADRSDAQTRIGALLAEHLVRPARSFAPRLR